jgi:hypothetical protein
MKKGIVAALVGVFAVCAVGSVAMAAEGADGKMTVDNPKAFGKDAKTKGAVTFNHKKHGADLGCVTCHHTQPTLGKDAAVKGVSCFTCHGPEAKDKQPSAKDIVHKSPGGRCVNCHKTDAKAMAAKAPTKCKECHGGAE